MNKTKKIIFKSALTVFSKNGYEGSTMDDIAEAAEVAKGTLYYHFKSKEEIFKYIIKEGMMLIKEEIEFISHREDDPLMRLKALCRVQLCLVYENRDFFKVVMSQLWGQQLRQFELRKSIENYIQYIQEYLKDAIDRGQIINGDVSFMAYTLFGTMCSAAVYELLNEDDTNVNNIIDNLIQYILKGIEV